MHSASTAVILLLGLFRLGAETLPSSVVVTIEPQKFGDVASILKVDSTVASFKFDRPVSHLALVLEARPREPRTVHVARLSLELTKPVQEGRFCVQMVDQGFLPLGNGSPNQMQLFLQLDCGGTLISSSQSFLKEKFNFSRSLARTGAGTLTRQVTGYRAPVLWLMGNSDGGTYFNDDDLEKMIAKNRDAYVLLAYLEVAKPPAAASAPPVIAKAPESPKPTAAPAKDPPDAAVAGAAPPDPVIEGPPYPVPVKEEIKPVAEVPPAKDSAKPADTKSSKSTKKKKKSS